MSKKNVVRVVTVGLSWCDVQLVVVVSGASGTSHEQSNQGRRVVRRRMMGMVKGETVVEKRGQRVCEWVEG